MIHVGGLQLHLTILVPLQVRDIWFVFRLINAASFITLIEHNTTQHNIQRITEADIGFSVSLMRSLTDRSQIFAFVGSII